MDEVGKQKEKPNGHEKLVNEGSAARTRPTSIEEIRLRRMRKVSLENVMEETLGAAQLLSKSLVEKASGHHESEKGYDRSKKLSREEHVKDRLRKKEDTSSSSIEEKLETPMKEDPVGAAHLPNKDLVEKVSDYHDSEKGNDRSEKMRHEELTDSSRKKAEDISSSREERQDKPMKDDPVGAAQLLGNDLVEKVSDCHASEKGHDRSKKVRREERVKDSSRNKEDATYDSTEGKPMKEDFVGADQLLDNNIVEKVSDCHASEKGHDRSKKVRRGERAKDNSRKKEEAISSSREQRPDKPMKEDPVGATQLLGNDFVEKVSDYHASEKRHDRSTKMRREEHAKVSKRKKQDAISSSREEKTMKEDHVGAARLVGNDLVEKVSDSHGSENGYDRSKKVRREEHVKDSSRKKEDAISSSREEKPMKEDHVGTAHLQGTNIVEKVSDYLGSEKGYDRSEKLRHKERAKTSSRKMELKNEEEPAANRKRKAEVENSTAETKLVVENSKDRRRKKEETNSSCREDLLDKKTKRDDDHAGNRKLEAELPTKIRRMTDRDGIGVDINMKGKRESSAAKTTEKHIRIEKTDSEQARSVLENLSGSRKRLRSLVVAEIPRDENSMKPDNENNRKNQNEVHEKNRERNMSKKHDSGKVHNVVVSERWEKREQPKSHQREMREKRRRSRSRDHGQDRQKRSSPLPRAEKTTSGHRRDDEHPKKADKVRSEKYDSNDHGSKVAPTVDNKARRYSGSRSELGGYSPRKRREEACAKAVSPPNLSSEKTGAKWDLATAVTAGIFSGSVFPGLQTAAQTAYPTISEASLTLLKPLVEVPFRTPLARETTSVDSVQLTESTRRLRRLYAENVPGSASEKSLIECLNSYMLSSGSNHIKGSEPCISCIINKEKSQALVEFLTPQDASAALSLDGCSFAGSNLKIRRPKDYVETTIGELEKKAPATNAPSDNVEDSSNKIFIGGIPKAISSEMLVEIVSVFGPLKAYRFVISNDLNQRCAFLEYTDGSVTLKACAGLNGMKLGGSVITAVCAFPDASSDESMNETPPFYRIPDHAKPLIGKPKHILKLKNLVDPEDLTSLSEQEVKELLEDVRLECIRFGVIKSINIVSVSETNASVNLESSDSKETNVSVIEEKNKGSKKANDIAVNVELAEVIRPDSPTGEDKTSDPCSDTAAETNTEANEDQQSTEQDHCEKIIEESAKDEPENPREVASARTAKTRWDTGDKIEEEQEQEKDPDDVFEPGSIFIEYRRPEATRDAAHSLHRRLYNNRIVTAEYVSKEVYHIRFPSG